MAIPVNAVARRKQYTVGSSGQQGPYAFTFNILADADLAVYVNSTLKSISTHYTVTTAANGTGSITFVAGQYPSEDDTVTLIGAKAIARTSDFTAGGDIKASTFNTELDTITIVQQQLEEIDDRSLQLDIHTTRDVSGATGPLIWPYDTTSNNANKVVAYTAAGNALELTDKAVSSASVSASNVAVTSAQAAGTATASVSLSSAGALAFTLGIPVGQTGMAGGVSMQYSTTTADADPGAGMIRFNNTSLNSATIMYVDDSDGTTDISAWVQSWDNSVAATRGYITICGNPNFASPLVIFKVNGAVTDASGYTKIPVAYVAGSTSISNAAEISVQFSPSGEGSHPGLDYTFSTTTADADPGAGVLRLNNGTLASVTAAYLDDNDANGVNVSTHVLTWDDSTHTSLRGYVKITKKTAPSTYALYSITGASTDASGYNKLALTHINSNGSFAADDPVSVHFTRTGDDGSDGSDADNVFKTIAVAGQDNVVADSTTDTLTLAAGSNITITTAAASDTITFAAADGGASLSNDGNNRVTTADGSGGINGEANLQFDGTQLGIGRSPTADLDILITDTTAGVRLESTDAGATDSPILELYRNSTSPAASDGLGKIEFHGEDSAGNKELYASIKAKIKSVTSGSEEGELHFHSMVDGSDAAVHSMVDGFVTFPKTSGFYALCNNHSNFTGDSTNFQPQFNNTELWDNRGDHNALQPSRFTAPVAGVYLFVFKMYMSGITSSHTSATQKINFGGTGDFSDELLLFSPYAVARGGSDCALSLTVIAKLDAGDTADPEIQVDNGSKVIDTGTDSRWAAYLLG